MIEIAEVLGEQPSPVWTMVRQCGVSHAVASIDLRPIADREVHADEQPFSYMSLLRRKTAYNNAGFTLSVIESRPPLSKAKLGLPGRDYEIDCVCELIRNMGRLQIPVWCYEWMPVFNWLRTSTTTPARGGALATSFDASLMDNAPLTEFGIVEESALWDSLEYFLKRVVPVAEEAGVKLAMHPDDPPLSPIRGLPRIMRSVGNFRRLLELVPSPVNGIALCQGNFTLMTDDLPEVIREFGAEEKIFFVHFRDVLGTPESFVETFHDEGKTDMHECIRAYRDIAYSGVLRPDHVPTMAGDTNDRPGYSSIGRLFAIGYILGLREAVYAEARP